MKTVSQLLIEAKAKIINPNSWIKRFTAEDENGIQVNSRHPNACKFCMVGALSSVAPHDYGTYSTYNYRSYTTAFKILSDVTLVPVSMFNDSPSTTHQDVLAAYDKAIKLAISRVIR